MLLWESSQWLGKSIMWSTNIKELQEIMDRCNGCYNRTEKIFKAPFNTIKSNQSFVSRSGCSKCKCNDHGDKDRGLCNNKTGECYCINHSTGRHCEKCEDGYYGDPR